MAVLLSQQIVVGVVGVWSMLSKSFCSQMHYFDALKVVVYSASHDKVATVFCFLACHDITPEPREYK